MRCVVCRTTGYTEAELRQHVLKSGHALPDDRSKWATDQDFDEPPRPKFSRAELIAALKEAQITPEDLAAAPEGVPP